MPKNKDRKTMKITLKTGVALEQLKVIMRKDQVDILEDIVLDFAESLRPGLSVIINESYQEELKK